MSPSYVSEDDPDAHERPTLPHPIVPVALPRSFDTPAEAFFRIGLELEAPDVLAPSDAELSAAYWARERRRWLSAWVAVGVFALAVVAAVGFTTS